MPNYAGCALDCVKELTYESDEPASGCWRNVAGSAYPTSASAPAG
jgi:hypothetical protein